MTRKYVNPLNGVIKHFGVGDTAVPVSEEDHLDVSDLGILVNAYTDESTGIAKSTNATANYAIFQDNDFLYCRCDDSIPINNDITWNEVFRIDGPREVLKHRGLQRTLFSYGTSATLGIYQSGCMISNKGAPGSIILTLPTATLQDLGVYYHFLLQAAFELKIVPAGGDSMRRGGAIINFVRSSTLDNCLTLVCSSIGVWVVEFVTGIWSIV